MEEKESCETCAFWFPFGDTCHPAVGEFRHKDGKCEFYQLSNSYKTEDTQLKLF